MLPLVDHYRTYDEWLDPSEKYVLTLTNCGIVVIGELTDIVDDFIEEMGSVETEVCDPPYHWSSRDEVHFLREPDYFVPKAKSK